MGDVVSIRPYIERKKEQEPDCDVCYYHGNNGTCKFPGGWRMNQRTYKCMDFKRIPWMKKRRTPNDGPF